jgi:hypothetical protein
MVGRGVTVGAVDALLDAVAGDTPVAVARRVVVLTGDAVALGDADPVAVARVTVAQGDDDLVAVARGVVVARGVAEIGGDLVAHGVAVARGDADLVAVTGGVAVARGVVVAGGVYERRVSSVNTTVSVRLCPTPMSRPCQLM